MKEFWYGRRLGRKPKRSWGAWHSRSQESVDLQS